MGFIHDLKLIISKLESTQKRLDWEEYFMSLAMITSVRSSCNRLHVGCALVKDSRILSKLHSFEATISRLCER